MSREATEPWASAMERAGLTDPRNGRPSISALARAIDAHTSTVVAMMYGTRETKPEVIQRAAQALVLDTSVLMSWVGRAQAEKDPFKAHSDADLLASEEREAVNEVIRLLALPKKQRVEPEADIVLRDQDGNVTAVIQLKGALKGVDVSDAREHLVHLLRTPPSVKPEQVLGRLPKAARLGSPQRGVTDRLQNEAGEESQDHEGFHPA